MTDGALSKVETALNFTWDGGEWLTTATLTPVDHISSRWLITEPYADLKLLAAVAGSGTGRVAGSAAAGISWNAAGGLGSFAAAVAALVAAATDLGQLELRHTELGQLEPALFLAVAGSAAVAAGVAALSRSTAGGVNRSSAGGVNRSTASWVSRSGAVRVNWCTAGWVNRSTAGGLGAAIAAAMVGLEQTEQTGLCAVGDGEHHQSSCESNCLHLNSPQRRSC